jgi:8-oxo-dGTP pyrophosphatase MutT (NUDIX family)
MSFETFDKQTKILEGSWNENTSWEFYLSPKSPPRELCTAIACLAILKSTDSIVLTRNQRGWEMLGGHIEEGESLEETVIREAREEGGFIPDSCTLFGYRKVIAKEPTPHDQQEGHYPYPLSYIPHFIAVTSSELEDPTGEEIFERAAFAPEEIETLGISALEIVRAGFKIYEQTK